MTGLIFGENEMAHWYAILPDSVRDHLPDDFREGAADYVSLSERIATSKIEDAHTIVVSEAEMFRRMGRARRIRFLTWAAKRSMPDRPSAWARILEKSDEGEEGSGGSNDVVDLFVDDIRAMAPPLAAITAAFLGDSANARIVAMAAQDVVHAPLPTGGMK